MLEGKTIFVTGAVNGIDAETARLARSLGARMEGVDT